MPLPAVSAVALTPGWDGQIAAWLASHKTYPDAARRAGEEGEVTMRFTVAADGQMLHAEIVHGSGSAALDEAARDLLANAHVPPPAIPQTRTVRIRYRLQ